MRITMGLFGIGVIVGLAVGPAQGQYRIEQGQVLDASLRVGAGGLNPARAPYDFNAGNRIMTGNVTLGRGFQGFSPISDVRAFGLGSSFNRGGFGAAGGLPSDRLTGFYRDSYNTADYRHHVMGRPDLAGAGRVTGPSDFSAYYSPYSTVGTTGNVLLGRSRAGTVPSFNPYQVPGSDVSGVAVNPLNEGMAQAAGPLGVPTRLVRVHSDQPVAGQVNERLLGSPLFSGAFREVPVTDLAQQAREGEGVARVVGGAPPASLMGPLDVRVGRPTVLAEGREDGFEPTRRGADLQRVLQRTAEDEVLLAPRLGQPTGTAADSELATEGPRLLGGPAHAGTAAARPADVFGWMRQVSGQQQLLRPTGPVEDEQPARTADQAVAEGSLVHETASPEPLAPSLETFVGGDDSLLNRQLAYAEEALKQGRYYRAAEAYLIARTIAADNPLPHLGRSMALLAAGDYLSSAGDLFEAVRLFGPLGAFRVDLEAFLPDVHVIDLRRADLERQLDVHEDARLRFLLGYAEYCSGLEEFGLKNMEQAIAQGPDALRTGTAVAGATTRPSGTDSFIQTVEQFVQTLKVRARGHDTPVELPDSP